MEDRQTPADVVDNQQPTESKPEPVGPIAEAVLDELAARQRAALNRLARAHRTTR